MESFEKVLPRLREIELFEDFAEDTEENIRILKKVYDSLNVVLYKKGDLIIKEGEEGDQFFILVGGSVQVLRNTPLGDKIALANLDCTQKVFFGEAALIGKGVRSATVKATSDCTTVVLSSKRFLDLCEEEPRLGYRVVSCLARRMSKTLVQTNLDKATLYEALYNEIETGF